MGRAIVGALLLATAVSAQSNRTAYVDPTSDFGLIPNNSLFLKWRQAYHVIAPAGWMNDPCGALYDPATDTYSLQYQFHPNHVNWGNISWGSARSKNMVTWEDVGPWENAGVKTIGTGPNGSYDHLGVFSGTAQPVNINGEADGTWTVFYTSVKRLPTSWTLPYLPGTESQSLATSKDQGTTWQKYEGNPVIDTPPPGWNITGWRDPFYHNWPEMDAVLGSDTQWYTIFGSGIKGVGPRLPLYTAPANDLTNWTFQGAIFEVEANSSWGGNADITGSYGFNFEVAGFWSIREREEFGGDGKSVWYVANFGTEGGQTINHPNNHWALWAIGNVYKRDNGSAEFNIQASGVGDWGNLYAVTSFNDTKNDRRVVWGWSEENLNDIGLLRGQGFQGCLGIPREWFIHVTSGVKAPSDGIPRGAEVWVEDDSTGLFTVKTLGARPLPDVVEGLRGGNSPAYCPDTRISGMMALGGFASDHYELKASISNITEGAKAGFCIRCSPGMEEYTWVTYDPATYFLTVDRTHSSQLGNTVTNTTYKGYFRPYEIEDGVEDMDFTIFVDGSLLEIFINNRFALTTRIYPNREDSNGLQMVVLDGSADYRDVYVYSDYVNVFPDRPLNSSSPLVYDTPEETDNYVWWPGF